MRKSKSYGNIVPRPRSWSNIPIRPSRMIGLRSEDGKSNQQLNILCVHGVGHGEADPNFESSWQNAITNSMVHWNPEADIQLDFLHYDQYFDEVEQFNDDKLSIYFEAASKLLASGLIHRIENFFKGSSGLFDFPEQLRWTAGMLGQWSTEESLRDKTRTALTEQLSTKKYDLVCAHCLGSLICYDTLSQLKDDEGKLKDLVFLSFGSQIGNPFVRDIFAGRIEALKNIRFWYHLYNPDDIVLTAPIQVKAENFLQVITQFDMPNDILNHDAEWYLTSPNAINGIWRYVSGASAREWLLHSPLIFNKAKVIAKPNKRALLIGINDYPDPTNRLDGCVNDVFLVSSLLQESGFKPEEIRVVLNERATAAGILERLHWLLNDTKHDDERVLFYSGHGAQIPSYSRQEEVDHLEESLVPYDFDWTLEHAVTDKQFCELYSQLPYNARFLAIFDCCHSSGMSRDGSRRIRGIAPPDDIRHRALRWNAELEMWDERKFTSPNPDLAQSDKGVSFLGQNQATHRIGRSIGLRSHPAEEYNRRRDVYGHQGPYLPVLMESCQESQLSYEYRHGVTSYGAYTYSLATVLRKFRKQKKRNPTFVELNKLVTAQLKKLKYDQTPSLLAPSNMIDRQFS